MRPVCAQLPQICRKFDETVRIVVNCLSGAKQSGRGCRYWFQNPTDRCDSGGRIVWRNAGGPAARVPAVPTGDPAERRGHGFMPRISCNGGQTREKTAPKQLDLRKRKLGEKVLGDPGNDLFTEPVDETGRIQDGGIQEKSRFASENLYRTDVTLSRTPAVLAWP